MYDIDISGQNISQGDSDAVMFPEHSGAGKYGYSRNARGCATPLSMEWAIFAPIDACTPQCVRWQKNTMTSHRSQPTML
ncbi:hypothetical protein [Bradyrhizobium cenepequi]|uniref:hypothetical protein n=1 Tax=Bradyrhizobium cenepequi TaxID=2821403 RepID=UPI001CE31EC6|nr:hypothetical protein [Bradyrhizobium cenepequi]MCA6108531.1 hypothetical protein [Bradyrhizobium cenepequi]